MVQAYTRHRQNKPASPEPAPELRRNSQEVRARRAATLLDNTELRARFDEVRTQIINDIELTALDGSIEAEAAMLERVRQLQSLYAVKAQILQPLLLQAQKNSEQT